MPALDAFRFLGKAVEIDSLTTLATEDEKEVTLADKTKLGRAASDALVGHARLLRKLASSSSSAQNSEQ
jgi:hypothetical protein